MVEFVVILNRVHSVHVPVVWPVYFVRRLSINVNLDPVKTMEHANR